MNEKVINLVIEALNSDSVKQSINSMLDIQSHNIIGQICKAIEKERNESEQEKHKILSSIDENFKKQIEELEWKKSELTADYENQISELKLEKKKLIADYEGMISELTQNYEIQMKELAQNCNDREAEVEKATEAVERLQNDLDAFRNQYNEMQNGFKSIIEAYDAFLSLGGQTKDRLRNIFVSDTLESFISACFDWDNVEGIWNYVKREVIEKSDVEMDNLHRIFRFMFQGYNARYREAQYVLISPVAGTKYNSEEQVILGIKTDGTISKVCLEGYRKPDGKVICKALVEV